MSQRPSFRGSTIFAGASLFWVLAASAPAPAAECHAQPGTSASGGAHWYYHVDRPSGRKCWRLVRPEDVAPSGPAGGPPSGPSAAEAQGGFPFFSFGSIPFGAGAPNGGNPPRVQSFLPTPEETLAPGAPNAERGPAKRPRPAADAGSETAAVAPAPKPRRAQGPLARPERPAGPPNAPINDTARAALFEDYLEWTERQKP